MKKLTNYGQKRACSNLGGESNNKYPKRKIIQLVKRTNCFLPHSVWETPITRAPTFYIIENKSGLAGYKSEKFSKVDLSPYDTVQIQNYMLF